MKTIAHWAEDGFDREKTGGKARALARACRAGFHVPDWFVVLPTAPDALLAGRTTGAPEEIRTLIEKIEIPPALIAEIGHHLEKLGGETFAVRSSGSGEDGAGHSHAGQFESFLNVPPHEVIDKIRAVWLSGFSDRVIAYRAASGGDVETSVPAVIVQKMIPCESAGVAFSSDPVSGRRKHAVVAAVRGLGDRLVGGSEQGENYRIDLQGRIVEKPASSAQILTTGQIQRIAEMARESAKLFGCPQDIEWGLLRNELFLLQSRPITNLANLSDPDEPLQVWDNSNIAESYNGVTTPLTFSFARKAYEHVYHQFVKILGVPDRRIEANRDVFPRMLGLIRGRVYYNLISWYRVLAMLPGYALNREFMEQMMGVRQPLPEEAQQQIQVGGSRNALVEWFGILRTLTGLMAAHVTLPSRRRRFLRRMERALATPASRYSTMTAGELASEYRELEARLLPYWDAPLINDFFAMIYFGVLRKLSTNWLGDEEGGMANRLVAGKWEVISAEPAKRIRQLAALVRGNEALVNALLKAPAWEVETHSREHAKFAAGIKVYLERFGDRCLEELKLESPTLADDPLPLYRSIGAMASREEREAPIEDFSEQDVIDKLDSRQRRWIFRAVLKQAQRRIADRENLRFERTRVFGRVRKIFVELGKRLFAAGILEQPRDAFYLTVEELVGLTDATAVSHRVKQIVKERKAEFDGFRSGEAPPDRFATRGLETSTPLPEQQPESTADAVSESERRGTPCCRGRVRGRARVIREPKGATIRPGEILVANRTDPGWVLLFPAADGLIVETGSPLSHSAIVSRELGLPSVLGVPEATQWLQDGDLVEMDGATGLVRKIDEDTPEN